MNMRKNEFILKLDKEIMPAVREQILKAYDDKLSFELPGKSSYTVNADYFWYEVGDIVCIGNHDALYYCVPKNKRDIVAKMRLAAEEIYKLECAKKAAEAK